PQIQLPEYKAKFMILMGDLAHKRTGVKEAAPYFNSAYETFKSVKAVSDWTILWILCIRLNMIDQYEKVCHLAERFPLQASLAHTDNTRLFSQYARAMMELGLYKKAEILMSSPVVCKLCKEEKNFQFQVLAWRIQVATQQKDKELVRKRLLEILDQIEPNNDEHLFVNLAIGEACERYPEFFQLCDQKLKDRAPLLLAILYANKAHYLRSKLNYLQALADYRSSHFYFDKTGKRYYPGRINVFSGEADTYIYLKEFEKARECLKLGTRYIDSSEKSDLKFSLRSMEGNLLREEGKNEEALRLHKELLEQIVRNGYSSAPMFGNVIGQIALDYKAMGQYDAAILVVEQSLPQIRAANIFSAEVARGVEKELTNIKELKAQREKRRAQK
ncbi:MAG: hypothetical protein K2Z81_27380, partial [Cyanobacteria bacterium]|nr:hypothetical protein [Cyanobacteriota bacterium]